MTMGIDNHGKRTEETSLPMTYAYQQPAGVPHPIGTTAPSPVSGQSALTKKALFSIVSPLRNRKSAFGREPLRTCALPPHRLFLTVSGHFLHLHQQRLEFQHISRQHPLSARFCRKPAESHGNCAPDTDIRATRSGRDGTLSDRKAPAKKSIAPLWDPAGRRGRFAPGRFLSTLASPIKGKGVPRIGGIVCNDQFAFDVTADTTDSSSER